MAFIARTCRWKHALHTDPPSKRLHRDVVAVPHRSHVRSTREGADAGVARAGAASGAIVDSVVSRARASTVTSPREVSMSMNFDGVFSGRRMARDARRAREARARVTTATECDARVDCRSIDANDRRGGRGDASRARSIDAIDARKSLASVPSRLFVDDASRRAVDDDEGASTCV
jgi:hypothetical protein